jgi:ATP-citrate lyase beta-subunit
MILYEFEGKQLLSNAGINVPKSQLITSYDQNISIKPPTILKAQVLAGGRMEMGGIKIVNAASNFQDALKDLFKYTNKSEKTNSVLIEEKIEHTMEYYVSISYDTDIRGLTLTISSDGGTGVESRGSKKYHISSLDQSIPKTDIPDEIIQKILKAFFENDCLLIEINPLVKSGDEWLALDAKVKLDDDAKKRHSEWQFPERSVPGHIPTEREIAAKQIDAGDHRGTAGSVYFDLDGDIGILASGGGISLIAMDALINAGGKPSNYTEYSGNPPREKVIKLTETVLSKPGLHALWIIGTVVANFTDIYETLMGIIDGIKEYEKKVGKKMDIPIVIRRGGPRDTEAFEELKKMNDYDFHLQGPEISIPQSASYIAKLAKKYATTS